MDNYVEEKYGFKVHTAYIAEVKRSLGLTYFEAILWIKGLILVLFI